MSADAAVFTCAACGKRYPKVLTTQGMESLMDEIVDECVVVCATCWATLDTRRKTLGWPAEDTFPVRQG